VSPLDAALATHEKPSATSRRIAAESGFLVNEGQFTMHRQIGPGGQRRRQHSADFAELLTELQRMEDVVMALFGAFK
jgi:hypothetical protein